MNSVSYGGFQFSQVPWLSKASFFQENRRTINRLFAQISYDFPESGAAKILDPHAEEPSPEAMRWMWEHLMGHQHGSQEGFDGKLPLVKAKESPYWPLIKQLHYGPFSFAQPHFGDPTKHYTHVLALGGTPVDMISITQAAINGDARRGNIDNLTLMAGQRLRWRVPGEMNVDDIYATVSKASGVDLKRLQQLSPWVREQESKVQREGDPWSGPYPTEMELARLVLETMYMDMIDWKNYDVSFVKDPNPRAQDYNFRGRERVVPPREDVLISYPLKNGKHVHVLNGKAVLRTLGVPRPNSDSQAREMVDLGLIGKHDEQLAIGVTLPHIRGGLDVLIRLLKLVGPSLKSVDIIAPPIVPGKEALAALGEIPATHKADLRLRALLSGKDPDSRELANL